MFLDMFSSILSSKYYMVERNFEINIISIMPHVHKFAMFAFSTDMHLRGIAQGGRALDQIGCCTMNHEAITFHFAKFDSNKMLFGLPVLICWFKLLPRLRTLDKLLVRLVSNMYYLVRLVCNMYSFNLATSIHINENL